MISSFLACRRSSRRLRASLVLDLRASAWSLQEVKELVNTQRSPQNSLEKAFTTGPGLLLLHRILVYQTSC